VVLVLVIGAGFWWSVASGQFDDLEGPAHRILADDDTSDVIPTAPSQCNDVAEQRDELTSIKTGPDTRP
jgi:cbb3-type cytochrome oxidase maturation protein